MEDPEGINIPVAWVGLEEKPIELANQFLIQHEPNEFILTIGQLPTPPLLGSLEEKQKQARDLEFIGIRTLSRVVMSPTRLRELIAILQDNLEKHDKRMSDVDPTRGS